MPDSAVGIALGVLLDGPGELWLNGADFEVVDTSVPTTGRSLIESDGPRNLDFSH